MAVPLLAAAAVTAAIQIAGQLMAQGERDKARKILEDALKEAEVPSIDAQRILAEQLGPSEAGAVKADPRLVAAQMSALNRLREVEEGGGETLADKAAWARMSGDLARHTSAGRNRIAEQMRSRGMGSSGAELAMQLANQQASADQAGQLGLDRAGAAQRRALEAMMGRGDLAGRMRGQQFEEDWRSASARDAITRYNADARARAQQWNKGLYQQQYDNRLRKAGLRGGVAADYHAGADRAQTQAANLGAAAYSALAPEDERKK